MTARERELFEETDETLPVDFHSWRRAYSQALADADVNAQQASALAGHASLAAHQRYLASSDKMRSIPEAALPRLDVVASKPELLEPPVPAHARDPELEEDDPLAAPREIQAAFAAALSSVAADRVQTLQAAIENSNDVSGADGTRTRGLRRDRPAL